MTTVQFAYRLLRNLTIKDLSLLPAGGVLGVLDAINAAVQKFYLHAPDIYKQTTASGFLRAGKQVEMGVVHGSAEFSGYTAMDQERGCTVRIGDDARDNEIVATNGLLDDYRGTTGTRPATIWGDCLQIHAVIDQVISDPKLETGDVLFQDDAYKQWGGFAYPGDGWRRIGLRRRQVGVPRRYWLESVGLSQGGAPAFLLRVDTLPDRDYRVRVDVQLDPKKVRFTDLSTPAKLPVKDTIVEAILLPLATAELTDNPLWEPGKSKDRALKRGELAISDIRLLSASAVLGWNRVGTPKGY